MPFTSAQISQMLGGQQVMFANQAAFAHNVGAQAGITPGGLAPLSQPSFGLAGYGGQDMGLPGLSNTSAGGYGAAMTGGLGGALPGMAAGASFAGGLGLLGHMGGYLDPFTGVGRAFMGGFGRAGGMAAFGAGGGAGIGAIGGGVAAAAGPAALYYAAYKGISHVGEQLHAGAQNISQVGAMAGQYFGPQFGGAGARPGGSMARGQIQEITSVLHEIAGQDTMTSMRDLKQLMDRAGQFGMLTGISSASEFKDKFKRIVGQAKQVAQMLGTTIEEGMGTLSGFKQMGMWTAQDVMGGAMAMKMVGPQGRGALMQTMQSGAQMSHAMGGSLAAGAALGRNQFLNVQAGLSSGLLSPEMIQEYTGGVGGIEGQQILAERMTGILQSTTQTPIGRLTMAGIGEFKNGKFTGRVDQELLRKMQTGQISVGELQARGQRNASSREGAASFTWRQEQIGQEMMAQGGLELMGGMFKSGLERAGFGNSSEEIQGLMLQKMYGMQRRDAMMMQKIIKDIPRMSEERTRKELAALQDQLRQVDERRNRSWEGLKDVIAHSFEETMERPLQELGESMATGINERVDRVSDYLMGRVKQINMTEQEKIRSVYSMGQRPGGMQDMQKNIDTFMQSSAQSYGATTMVERMRRGGVFGGFGAAMDAAMGVETGLGTRGEQLVASGAMTTTNIEEAGNLVVSNVGAGTAIRSSEVARTAEAIRRRAGAPTAGKMFNMGEGPTMEAAANESNLASVRTAYRSMLSNTANLKKLKEMKENMSPAEYARALTGMLRKQGGPEVAKALDELRKINASGGTGLSSDLDALSVVQGEDAWKASFLQADFGEIASDTSANMQKLLQDGEAFSKSIDADVDKVLALAGGMTQQQAIDMFGASKKGISKISGMTGKDTGFSRDQLRDFLTQGGPMADELNQFLLDGGKDLDPAKYPTLFKEAQNNSKLQTFLGNVGEMNPTQIRFMQEVIGGGIKGKMGAKAFASYISGVGDVAAAELGKLGGGGTEEERGILGQFVKAGATANFDLYQQTRERAVAYGKTLTPEQAKALRKRGGAMAEHLADVSDIENMNLTGKTGKSLAAGLQDDYRLMEGVAPEEFKKVQAILESGNKITKEQNDQIKNIFAEFEKRIGAGGSVKAAESIQDQTLANLRGFVGANEAFVLAVKSAVPNLKDVTVAQITAESRKISEGGATGGTSSGKQ